MNYKDILGLLILPLALMIIAIIYIAAEVKYFGSELARVVWR